MLCSCHGGLDLSDDLGSAVGAGTSVSDSDGLDRIEAMGWSHFAAPGPRCLPEAFARPRLPVFSLWVTGEWPCEVDHKSHL